MVSQKTQAIRSKKIDVIKKEKEISRGYLFPKF